MGITELRDLSSAHFLLLMKLKSGESGKFNINLEIAKVFLQNKESRLTRRSGKN
jgi:hypothetical protein